MNTKKLIISLATAVALLVSGTGEALCCTTAIVGAKASATGRPMIWKQRDTSTPGNHIAYDNSGTHAFTGLLSRRDSTHTNVWIGVNDAGFAVMNNQSNNVTDLEYEDINGEIMADALRSCATLDDFEDMLRSLPHPWPGKANFGAIDAQGGAAYFEYGGDLLTRYDVPEDGWMVRTNYSLSGIAGKGSGFARYETATFIMERHRGRFGVSDLTCGLGRSFRNQVFGRDLVKGRNPGYAWDEDFIPRQTTVASICIEGAGMADAPGSSILWAAPGYTPACYSIPVWVAAGDEIPQCLAADANGDSAANLLATELKESVHDLGRDAAKKYINLTKLKPIMKEVCAAEKKEIEAGHALDADFRRRGFDLSEVRRFNEEADRRFSIWEKMWADLQ